MTVPTMLSSNGVEISYRSGRLGPMAHTTPDLGKSSMLRVQLARNGYLYLRGVLPTETVLSLREAYFSRFEASVFESGTSARDGVFSGKECRSLPAYGTFGHPAYHFVRSPEFEAFSRREDLRSLAETLLGGKAELMQRRIVRHYDYLSQQSARAHRDIDYMRGGSDRFVTLWIPLGPCPVDTGGLVYLEASHKLDLARIQSMGIPTDRPADRRAISHDLEATARALNTRWLYADYAAGDIAVHSPYMVHASLDCTTKLMRLSVDLRFQLIGGRLAQLWRKDWIGNDDRPREVESGEATSDGSTSMA